jgi:anti-anti-sigma regulatory factor
MASNFKIQIHRNSDNVHLSLFGSFDGNSAYELLNILKDKCENVRKVFIHTCGISTIHPFGQSVFLNNFKRIRFRPQDFMITGNYKAQLDPVENN